MKDLYHPSKKEFQLERIILFSDAVFAIAITLLIIDIKVPDIHGLPVSDTSFWQAFQPTIPKLVSFLFSFAMIAMYWTKHHQVFGYVTKFSGRLVFLNFLFILGIVVIPYTTAVYSEYSESQYAFLLTPFLFYTLNIIVCSLSLFFLWNYVGNAKNEVTDFVFDKQFLTLMKRRTLILPLVFIVSFLVSWEFHSPVGRFVLFTIPVWFWIFRERPKENIRLKNRSH